MITGELKAKVDRIWDAFWSGGIANPLEVMEQITDPGLLYEPPFTALAPGGPEALFANREVDELITAIRAVDSSTRLQDEAA